MNSIMILSAAPLQYRNHDCEYAFRQDSYFYYVSGFEESMAVVMLVKQEDKAQSILFCQEDDPKQARWTGPKLGPTQAAKALGFDEAYSITETKKQFLQCLKGIEHVYFLPGLYPSFDKKLFAWVGAFRQQAHGKEPVPAHFLDARNLLSESRLLKDDDEVAAIKAACSISVAAHLRAMKTVRPGMFEYELEAELLHEFYRRGSRAPAYGSIVAGGENACILHYVDNNKPLKDGDLVLIDAGAELNLYSSDITRTFPVNGKFSSAQKEVYEVVLAAQEAAIAQAREHQPWPALQAAVLDVLVDGLVALKILKGNKNDLIESRAYMPFYMHNCGHWMGLDVHDAGFYHEQGTVRKLQNGMVFTVEPGLYFPSDDPAVPEAFRGIGIRIEDDILIEKGEAVVLTSGVPKSIAAIEEVMSA